MDTIQQHSYKQSIFFSLMSGILTAICFPPCSFSSLSWFCLIPWFYTLHRQSFRQMLLSHFFFQACFWGIGIYWMSSVHPICPVAILLPMYFICLPFPVLFWWAIKEKKFCVFFVPPVLWVGQEYLRSFLFSGFPYLFMGHSQAMNPNIIQIADLTGVYGVSYAIVVVNALLCFYLESFLGSKKQRSRIIAYTAFGFIVISSIFLYGNHKIKSLLYDRGPKIASIQGNIPQDIKDDPHLNRQKILEAYTELTVQALKEKVDLLVWPETMSPEDVQLDPHIYSMFQDIARKTETSLLIGSHFYDMDFKKKDSKTYNSAYFINTKGEIVERYDKIRLVIVGEYVPLRNTFPVIPAIIKNIAGFIPDLQEGTRRPLFSLKDKRFGCLICYDIAYSEDARILRKQGADFLINITNEGWFFDTAELEQLLGISIFRAVENRMGILRSTNSGISLMIPPTGIITKEDTLTLPIEQYVHALPDYLRKRIVGKSTLAWHHLPQAIWQGGFLTTGEKNWDILWDGQKLKWKDFPGFFSRQVPLATKEISFYTHYGDIFALCMSCICLVFSLMMLSQFLTFFHQKKLAKECRDLG
ncbi:MAG: apolipoprotein N-acyltransferase [Candidatus Brocadiae bacterium]|nr:apolipoprotein N-acyltransferase [Candidatus Brocadiia bacterium]